MLYILLLRHYAPILLIFLAQVQGEAAPLEATAGILDFNKTLNVDDGEREAICLAREVNAVAILMDDKKRRAEAVRCGLRVAGTIGLLEAAAQRQLVDFSATIQRLRQTNARLDEEVIQAALSRLRSG
jgi:predicted nucleic acid-binding protein